MLTKGKQNYPFPFKSTALNPYNDDIITVCSLNLMRTQKHSKTSMALIYCRFYWSFPYFLLDCWLLEANSRLVL